MDYVAAFDELKKGNRVGHLAHGEAMLNEFSVMCWRGANGQPLCPAIMEDVTRDGWIMVYGDEDVRIEEHNDKIASNAIDRILSWRPASDVPKIAYVDFDGTICYDAWPKTGATKPHAVRVLKRMVREGWRIVLWTARESFSHDPKYIGEGRDVLQEAIDWFKANDIPLAAVNETPHDLERRTNGLHRKPIQGYAIDDMVVGGFIGWLMVEQLIFANNEQEG